MARNLIGALASRALDTRRTLGVEKDGVNGTMTTRTSPFALPFALLCSASCAQIMPGASGTLEDRQTSPPLAEKGASRLAPRDQPEECVTLPSAERELARWKNRVSKQLGTALSGWANCFAARNVANGHQMVFEVAVDQAGKGELSVRASHDDMCSARPCLEHELAKLTFESPPESADAEEAFVASTLTHYPLTTSRLAIGEPLVELSTNTSCADAGTARGELLPQAVATVIQSQAASLQACYLGGLARHQDLEGQVTTRFDIGPQGGVTNVETQDNTLASCQVVACVRETFANLVFAPPSTGSLTVVYPLTFERPDPSLQPTPDRQRAIPQQQGRPVFSQEEIREQQHDIRQDRLEGE